MLEDSPTTGSVVTTLAEKHRLRDASAAFNAKDPVFAALFPELLDGAPFEVPKPPATADARDSTESDTSPLEIAGGRSDNAGHSAASAAPGTAPLAAATAGPMGGGEATSGASGGAVDDTGDDGPSAAEAAPVRQHTHSQHIRRHMHKRVP